MILDPTSSPDISTTVAGTINADTPADSAPLTPIEPGYIWVLRTQMAIPLFLLVLLCGVAEYALLPRHILHPLLPMFTLTGIALAAKILLVWHLPNRRLVHIAYHMGPDHLRITRGYLFRVDTLIPLARVQHIDVRQGPLERFLGLASLTIHTSGMMNQAVTLPGLSAQDADVMRAAIHRRIQSGLE